MREDIRRLKRCARRRAFWLWFRSSIVGCEWSACKGTGWVLQLLWTGWPWWWRRFYQSCESLFCTSNRSGKERTTRWRTARKRSRLDLPSFCFWCVYASPVRSFCPRGGKESPRGTVVVTVRRVTRPRRVSFEDWNKLGRRISRYWLRRLLRWVRLPPVARIQSPSSGTTRITRAQTRAKSIKRELCGDWWRLD